MSRHHQRSRIPRSPALLLLLLLLPALAHAQSTAELQLLRLANADRARYQLPPVTWDPALAAAAHTHALALSRHPGQLEHQLPGEPDLVARASTAGARFGTVSENLAAANVSLPQIEDGWMHSPPHRHTLLNPDLDHIGISLVEARGMLYIVEDLSRAVPLQSLVSIERSVAHSLLDRGLSLVSLSPTARQACRTANQNPEDPTRGSPSSVIQWDGPDPTTLPSELTEELTPERAATLGRAHPFRTALVGACPAQETAAGFSGYRVAVLLY